MLPVAVGEVRRRPDVVGPVALLEDGGDRLVARRLEFGAVGLHPDGFVLVGKGAHAPRLRSRRLRVTPNACDFRGGGGRTGFPAVRNGDRPGPAVGPRVTAWGCGGRFAMYSPRSTNGVWPARWRAPTSR